MDGAMGSSAVNAARFIEANELQHDAHFVRYSYPFRPPVKFSLLELFP